MKITRNKIIGTAVILCVLGAVFLWGGDFAARTTGAAEPDQGTAVSQGAGEDEINYNGVNDSNDVNGANDVNEANDAADDDSGATMEGGGSGSSKEGLADEANASIDGTADSAGSSRKTEKMGENAAVSTGGQVEATGPKEFHCTLSIRCDTLLDNMGSLNKDKIELVPADGIILAPAKVVFYEGESVFNVLQRETKKNKIHMEFVKTPTYNSVYIEGIHNLYEFDCGELSGWMYKVNSNFPGYGSSRYQLQDGDTIEWVYSCDWGRDVGSSVGGKQQ